MRSARRDKMTTSEMMPDAAAAENAACDAPATSAQRFLFLPSALTITVTTTTTASTTVPSQSLPGLSSIPPVAPHLPAPAADCHHHLQLLITASIAAAIATVSRLSLMLPHVLVLSLQWCRLVPSIEVEVHA